MAMCLVQKVFGRRWRSAAVWKADTTSLSRLARNAPHRPWPASWWAWDSSQQMGSPWTQAFALRLRIAGLRLHAIAPGKDLEAFRRVDPDLVEKEAIRLGGALKAVLEPLPEGGRALIVGHSPTTEAAILGLTGQVVPPIAKGAGVRVVEEDGRYRVEAIP